MQEINAWLNSSRDFNAGLELYAKYGASSLFKEILQLGPAPYTIKKLEAELKALAPATPAKPEESKTPNVSLGIQSTDQNKPIGKTDPKDMERYLSLKALLKQTYRQIERNMTILDLSNDESILRQTANQILTLYDKVTDIFDLIDFFDDHNKFPTINLKEKIVKTSDAELQSLYESICKAEKRLASGNCRNPKKTRDLIDKNKVRITELKERMAHERD